MDWISEYDALTEHAGLVDLAHRTQIELGGADRSTFLHNLCTNEIRKLPPGAGCEAFLTSVQGKTLAHVFVFAGPDSLVLETVAGESEKILSHLDHYLICEQVTLTDRSHQWSELLLGGAQSEGVLGQLTDSQMPEARLANAAAILGGRPVWLRRVDLAGPVGFLISAANEDLDPVRAALRGAGAVACPAPAFDAARIEWGFPLFGHDIWDTNLPQEVARDPLAISFVKGCYLGQETVARIDALGHVNKTLTGLRFPGATIPPVGLELRAGDQTVGRVTSAAYSPRLGAPLALGYVRRGSNAPGTRLTSELGDAEVIALPIQ
ncbi:MAG: aminomethyl transferase family protein [Planctomycetia bacterium]|nr:aminomethyl transferase family protein [Planctomycetia bacterium]